MKQSELTGVWNVLNKQSYCVLLLEGALRLSYYFSLCFSALHFFSFCPEHSGFSGCIVVPLIYHISNYIQFEPFIIFLLLWHRLPAGINKVSSNLNLMKLCQTQGGALVALFSADFKLSLVLHPRCFDITTDGLLLSFVSHVTFTLFVPAAPTLNSCFTCCVPGLCRKRHKYLVCDRNKWDSYAVKRKVKHLGAQIMWMIYLFVATKQSICHMKYQHGGMSRNLSYYAAAWMRFILQALIYLTQ